MSAFVAWLDYSERERRQALDVIDLFREQDTRDELGIGTIRDALADRLFPGINTIQTRARYFLFVPWTYQELERRRVTSAEAPLRARKEEIALIEALVRAGDTAGVIGIEARASLKRLPSSIYWLGLGMLGIRLFGGSQDQYFATLDARREATSRRTSDDSERGDVERIPSSFHPALPPRPADFPAEATFHLTREEADFLRERILSRVPETYLAFLVDEAKPGDDVGFPWEHPLAGRVPETIAEDLLHARNFSESVHGAALLYNLMLAEKAEKPELVDDYKVSIREWADTLVARGDVFAQWDRTRLWTITGRIPLPTRAFIERWLDLVFPKGGASKVVSAATLIDSGRARMLIHERERQLKKGQARLDNPSALRLWNGAAGTRQLSYRWPSAQAILNDILVGLEEEEVRDA